MALLKFEWRSSAKGLWGWVCYKCLSAWVIWVPTSSSSRWLGQLPPCGVKCVHWPVKAPQLQSGGDEFWRNVAVSGARRFERSDWEEQALAFFYPEAFFGVVSWSLGCGAKSRWSVAVTIGKWKLGGNSEVQRDGEGEEYKPVCCSGFFMWAVK